MIGSSHIGICVSDMNRSLRFYTELLGAREGALLDMKASLPATYREMLEIADNHDGFSKFVQIGEIVIELLSYTRDGEPGGHVGLAARRPMNRLGLTHLCLRSDDRGLVDEVMKKAEIYGGQVLDKTHMAFGEYGGQKMDTIFLLDPDGTRIELFCAPREFRFVGL
jgi:glyoxylase I family protein